MNKKVKYLLWSIAIILVSFFLINQWSGWPIVALMLGGSMGVINAVVFYFLDNKVLKNKFNRNIVFLNILRVLSILAIHYILFFTYLKFSGYSGLS